MFLFMVVPMFVFVRMFLFMVVLIGGRMQGESRGNH